jgi:hypothetical protein
MTYIVFHDGVPQVSEEIPRFRPNRLGLLYRFWESTKVYGHDSVQVPLLKADIRFTALQKFLAHTIYNPRESVDFTWVNRGGYKLSAIIEDLRHGLEKDDDIIQQWFDADDVLRLVSAAGTFDEMVLAFRCIEGAHVDDREAKLYVQRVLGSQQGDTADGLTAANDL